MYESRPYSQGARGKIDRGARAEGDLARGEETLTLLHSREEIQHLKSEIREGAKGAVSLSSLLVRVVASQAQKNNPCLLALFPHDRQHV